MIPAIEELKEWDQWVAWSRSKVPISPRGRPAKSTDRSTWGTLEEAKFIRAVQSLPGVGFVFSPDDPYVGIDLDDAVDPVTDEIKPWALEIVEELNSYTELSPSELGVHIIVRGDIPRSGARKHVDGVKVECYKEGRYFTVTGKHVKGTPNTIENRDLFAWFEEVFGEEEKRPDVPTWTPPDDWEAPGVESWLADALTYLDSTDYHEWVKVGLAIKDEMGDRGFYFWNEWSAGSEKYDGEAKALRKWNSFGDSGGVTIASLVWMAEQNGFVVPRGGAVIPDGMNDDWDAWISAQEGVEDPEGMGLGLELVIHDAADLYKDKSPFEPDLISPGVLGTGDMMLLFGPPKSMKSMVIMDMFRQFALGREWCGMHPLRPLRTLYAQFEVKGDKMRQRLQLAHLSDTDIEALRGMLMITDRFTPILSAEFVTQFAELALRTFKTGLDVLILDPLANIYSGDSENDNAQMARFIRQIKVLRNAINPSVSIVLVHHSSKMDRDSRHSDPFNASRGASALRGAYDTGIYLDRFDEESDVLKMWLELRNGPRRTPFLLEFENGRFEETEDPEQRDFDFGDLNVMDPERVEIERLLCEEAVIGHVYTVATFAESFAGGTLGSAGTIRRHISRLATRGAIGWFRSIGEDWLPEAHHRANGYLCCRSMVLMHSGRIHQVVPERMKDRASGVVFEVNGWPE